MYIETCVKVNKGILFNDLYFNNPLFYMCKNFENDIWSLTVLFIPNIVKCKGVRFILSRTEV